VGNKDISMANSFSKMGPGKIGVVTVTYNSADVLPEFLDSIAVQTYSDFVVYVIDNASKDDTIAICKQRSDLPLVLVPNETNIGVAEGNNQGIRKALEAGCEYVLLLNNDTVFDGNLIAQLQSGLVEHQCAMITPKILYHDNPQQIWAAGGYFQRWLGYRVKHYGSDQRDSGRFEEVRTITYAPTCCVLVRSSVFDQIGLMDPAYFVYSDDTDFMYRAGNAGLEIKYLPGAKVFHKVSSLTGGAASPFTMRYCTRNRIYFIRKHLPAIPAAFWAATYYGYLLSRYLMRMDKKSAWTLKRAAILEGLKMPL